MDPESLLHSVFGFGAFREGQRDVIDALLAGNSALAVFPTGAGKSLCYQLPAVALDGVTLVVSPLISLMREQTEFLRSRGVAAARLDSSLSEEEVRDVFGRLRGGALRILFVAPERFNNERFLSVLDSLPIALLAIDEAHCISEWGHNFRPDYLKLSQIAKRIGAERVLALTATATPAVIADVRRAFVISPRNTVVTGFYRSNLELQMTATSVAARDDLLVERLRSRPSGATLVYVTFQRTAERVATMLATHGFAARPYHAGLPTAERAAVHEWWHRSEAAIVVATIAFGMGIDKPNVRYVYHYNMPKSVEGYMQEIGRAGRDGLPATVELFAASSDLGALEMFSYGDTPTAAALRGLVASLLALPEHFDVSVAELSAQHDMRPTVLRTALTYLELAGAIRQGAPFFSLYEVRPHVGPKDLYARLDATRAQLAQTIFAQARRGRTWFTISPDPIAIALGVDREAIVRLLCHLAELALVELRTSGVRLRFQRMVTPDAVPSLAAALIERFIRREAHAIAQAHDMAAIVTTDACQTNAVVGYFGEMRTTPCGHCSFCLVGRAPVVPRDHAPRELSEVIDTAAVKRIAASHPRALGDSRQLARFLAGLASPATTAAKLTHHPLFGVLEERRFTEVLTWCEELVATAPVASSTAAAGAV